jgi:hypothetical protein
LKTSIWLKQCEQWTEHDHELFEIGRASGTAIHPKTGEPYTMKDIKQIVDNLPY